MTAKQQVLNALIDEGVTAEHRPYGWAIVCRGATGHLGSGATASLAWTDAARTLSTYGKDKVIEVLTAARLREPR